ncbi:MAG: hypothetical protein H6546_02850 [Chitinophagales bacterium]|nr:hypothetical protein [Chitinophagales bacterium]
MKQDIRKLRHIALRLLLDSIRPGARFFTQDEFQRHQKKIYDIEITAFRLEGACADDSLSTTR